MDIDITEYAKQVFDQLGIRNPPEAVRVAVVGAVRFLAAKVEPMNADHYAGFLAPFPKAKENRELAVVLAILDPDDSVNAGHVPSWYFYGFGNRAAILTRTQYGAVNVRAGLIVPMEDAWLDIKAMHHANRVGA